MGGGEDGVGNERAGRLDDTYYLPVDDGCSSRGKDVVVSGVPVHPHVVE